MKLFKIFTTCFVFIFVFSIVSFVSAEEIEQDVPVCVEGDTACLNNIVASLDPEPCLIQSGQSTCSAKVFWDAEGHYIKNGTYPYSYYLTSSLGGSPIVDNYFYTGEYLVENLPYGQTRDFFLYFYTGPTLLDQTSMTARCDTNAGLEWNGSVCEVPVVVVNYTLTTSKTGSGTITSNPAGISCGTDCTEAYVSGSSVTLTATPSAGYTFSGWSGACSGTGTCNVSMTANKSVTATFTAIPVTYTLTVNKVGSGTVTGAGTYSSGTTATATATPSAGYTFSGWSGCTSTSGSTCHVTMSSSKTVTATFTVIPVVTSGTLTASDCSIVAWGTTCYTTLRWSTTNPVGTSSVTTDYPSVNTIVATANSNTGKSYQIPEGPRTFYLYNNGVLLAQATANGIKNVPAVPTNLIATPNASCGTGQISISWGSSSGATSYTLRDGASVIYTGATRSFSHLNLVAGSTHSYSVLATNSGGNSAYSNPVTATAPSSCPMSGSLTPATSSCTIASGSSSCTVNLNWSIANPVGTPTAITANGMTNIDVSTSLATPQSGTRTVTVPYSSRTFYLYNNGVELSSSVASASCANAGDFWNGSICTPIIYTLTTSKTGSGTITSNPAGISCGIDCTEAYVSGTSVTLTATPSAGYQFSSWSGCTSTSGSTCYVTMSSSKTVTATFAIPAMSGSLTPATSSCTIASGASSCNVNLNWSIANPVGTPTAITANGMTDINVTSTLATPQSGTRTVTVPYSSRTFYFYNNGVELSSSVANASCAIGTGWDVATGKCVNNVDCVIGDWGPWSSCSVTECGTSGIKTRTRTVTIPSSGDGKSCPANLIDIIDCYNPPCPEPENGACSSPQIHYTCADGAEPTDKVNGSDTWTWVCPGVNGGASTSCSELKPKPIYREN